MKKLIYLFVFLSYSAYPQATTTYKDENGNTIATEEKDKSISGTSVYKDQYGRRIGTSETETRIDHKPINSGAAQIVKSRDNSWMRGAAMVSSENVSRGHTYYDKAYQLMIDEEYTEALVNLKKAESLYLRSFADKNYLNNFYITMAVCYLRLDDQENILIYLNKLGSTIKSQTEYLPTIAQLYYYCSDYNSSIRYYKKTIRINEYNEIYDWEAYDRLSDLYLEIGEEKKSEKIKEREERLKSHSSTSRP